jgi:hypothetical protein
MDQPFTLTGAFLSSSFNEALGLEASKYSHDICPTGCFRYLEFSHYRSAKIIHRPGLFQRLPEVNPDALEAEIDRPLEVQNHDFVVDLAGNLTRRFPVEE